MRVRKLTADGDVQFGHSLSDFWIDVPEAVGQVVQSRLEFAQGEWFLNLEDGTPYNKSILGAGHAATYDQAFRDRILGSPGVTELKDYASDLDRATRDLTVSGDIDTVYGETTVQAIL